MTFIIKTRGAIGCAKSTEFDCDDCGIFELVVGDTVASAPCPDCGAGSSRIVSAPMPRNLTVLPTAVVRGKDDDRRPGQLDTRPLADGMPYSQWKKLQDNARRDRKHKKLVDAGLVQKRIQVGGGTK